MLFQDKIYETFLQQGQGGVGWEGGGGLDGMMCRECARRPGGQIEYSGAPVLHLNGIQGMHIA